MPGKKPVKIQYQGQTAKAIPVEVTSSNEPWSSYLLEDGTTVKIRTVVTQIFRLVDHHDNMGNPVYVTQSQNLVAATPSADSPE